MSCSCHILTISQCLHHLDRLGLYPRIAYCLKAQNMVEDLLGLFKLAVLDPVHTSLTPAGFIHKIKGCHSEITLDAVLLSTIGVADSDRSLITLPKLSQ